MFVQKIHAYNIDEIYTWSLTSPIFFDFVLNSWSTLFLSSAIKVGIDLDQVSKALKSVKPFDSDGKHFSEKYLKLDLLW